MTPLTGQLRNTGSLNYLLLDNSYRMAPLSRAKGTTFTNFLARSDDAPRGVNEPVSGPPPAAAAPYLIQRNNNTFQDASRLPPETGKTILAFCSQKQILLVAVQPHGASPGQTHADIAFDLIQPGFDNAIFLDGSDSATMVVDGKIIVAPGQWKDNPIDVGVGFFR